MHPRSVVPRQLRQLRQLRTVSPQLVRDEPPFATRQQPTPHRPDEWAFRPSASVAVEAPSGPRCVSGALRRRRSSRDGEAGSRAPELTSERSIGTGGGERGGVAACAALRCARRDLRRRSGIEPLVYAGRPVLLLGDGFPLRRAGGPAQHGSQALPADPRPGGRLALLRAIADRSALGSAPLPDSLERALHAHAEGVQRWSSWSNVTIRCSWASAARGRCPGSVAECGKCDATRWAARSLRLD